MENFFKKKPEDIGKARKGKKDENEMQMSRNEEITHLLYKTGSSTL